MSAVENTQTPRHSWFFTDDLPRKTCVWTAIMAKVSRVECWSSVDLCLNQALLWLTEDLSFIFLAVCFHSSSMIRSLYWQRMWVEIKQHPRSARHETRCWCTFFFLLTVINEKSLYGLFVVFIVSNWIVEWGEAFPGHNRNEQRMQFEKDSCIFISLSTGSTMGRNKFLREPRVSQQCRVVRVSRVKATQSRNRADSRIPSVCTGEGEVFWSSWHMRILVGDQLAQHSSEHRRNRNLSTTEEDHHPNAVRRERARVSDSHSLYPSGQFLCSSSFTIFRNQSCHRGCLIAIIITMFILLIGAIVGIVLAVTLR